MPSTARGSAWARRAFQLLLGRRMPQTDGELTVAARGPITLRRDVHGVAYVDALDETDAWFGLGFCHAQDRAGQLELVGRAARGTLSEVIGPETHGVDPAVRLIGSHRAARTQLA